MSVTCRFLICTKLRYVHVECESEKLNTFEGSEPAFRLNLNHQSDVVMCHLVLSPKQQAIVATVAYTTDKVVVIAYTTKRCHPSTRLDSDASVSPLKSRSCCSRKKRASISGQVRVPHELFPSLIRFPTASAHDPPSPVSTSQRNVCSSPFSCSHLLLCAAVHVSCDAFPYVHTK